MQKSYRRVFSNPAGAHKKVLPRCYMLTNLWSFNWPAWTTDFPLIRIQCQWSMVAQWGPTAIGWCRSLGARVLGSSPSISLTKSCCESCKSYFQYYMISPVDDYSSYFRSSPSLSEHRVALVCSARSSSTKAEGTTNRWVTATQDAANISCPWF